MKELEKTYNPSAIEEKLYQKWLDNKYFRADAAEWLQDQEVTEVLFVYQDTVRRGVRNE